MIKIITALLNPKITKELKKDIEIEVMSKDIQYEEGIIEAIENIKEIDFLIINKQMEKTIKKVREINKTIKIIKIQIDKNKKTEEIVEKIKSEIKQKKIEIKETENKIITIIGTGGIGKSIISIMIAYFLGKKHKIAILDFDILKQNLHTILGVKKYQQKINKQIDLLSDIKYFKNNKIENIFKEIKNKYEYSIIDTSSQITFFPIKNIIKNSENIILIIEANLLEIKKAKEIILKYTEKNIKIIINKNNKYSIDEKIIKNIFKKNEIIGIIKYNSIYNFFINKNFEEDNIPRKIKQEYKKIINKIEGEKNGNSK